jgi:hypothetical protein
MPTEQLIAELNRILMGGSAVNVVCAVIDFRNGLLGIPKREWTFPDEFPKAMAEIKAERAAAEPSAVPPEPAHA